MMSDQEEPEAQRDEQQIAKVRDRDERAAKLLGEYIPIETMLHEDDEHANVWHDTINFLEHVSDAGPDDLASSARALLERVHVL
jgi:hypothetical protein